MNGEKFRAFGLDPLGLTVLNLQKAKRCRQSLYFAVK